MRIVILFALLAFVSCSDETPPLPSAGVGPDSTRAPVAPKSSVDLVEPIESVPLEIVEPTPVVASAAPKIQFEIDPLGRFEVITWEEALRRAESKITAQTAEPALRALRQDILGRKR